jgi:hypothetical protein
MVARILFRCDIQEITHPTSVPGESEHSSSKVGVLQMGLKTQYDDILEKYFD